MLPILIASVPSVAEFVAFTSTVTVFPPVTVIAPPVKTTPVELRFAVTTTFPVAFPVWEPLVPPIVILPLSTADVAVTVTLTPSLITILESWVASVTVIFPLALSKVTVSFASVTVTFFPPLTSTVPAVPETFTLVVAAAVKSTESALVTFKVSTPVNVVVSNFIEAAPSSIAPVCKLITSIFEIVGVTAVIRLSLTTFKISFLAPPSNESIPFNVAILLPVVDTKS